MDEYETSLEARPYIAKMLTKKRRELGVGQRTIAKKARLSHSTVLKAENGKAVNSDNLLLILEALGLELVIQPKVKDELH